MGALYTLAMLSVLVLVHELGHLAVGLLLGAPVKKVKVFLGPGASFKLKSGIEVAFGIFPLGGFVQFDGDEEALKEGLKAKAGQQSIPTGLLALPPWKRCAIAFAGPLASLLLPSFVVFAVWVVFGPSVGMSIVESFVGGAKASVALPLGIIEHVLRAIGVKTFLGYVSGLELVGPIDAFANGSSVVAGGIPAIIADVCSWSYGVAVVNLVPFPGLDGGTIAGSLVEMVVRRRPTLRTLAFVRVAGMLVLVCVMVSVLARDTMRAAGWLVQ